MPLSTTSSPSCGLSPRSRRVPSWLAIAAFAIAASFVAGGVALGPKAAAAADEPKAGTDIPEQSQIRFEQDRAEAHMRELEHRMFRLAELLKESEPDDASRLILGVQRAREELIADRMKGASTLLEELQLSKAVSQQTEIIEQLEALRELLLSIDIDLELKLEQLRKLREAQRLLANLIDRETDQNAETEKAEAKDAKPSAGETDALKNTEDRNRRLAEDLIAKLARFGNRAATASGQIGKASSSMKSASAKLGSGQCKAASKDQAKALEKLDEAEANLRDLEQELQKELEKFVLRRIMETLDVMVAQQRAVREDTARLSTRATEGQASAVAAVKELQPAESELLDQCDYIVELCELVNLSHMLPAAIESVGSEIETVVTDLGEGRATDTVIETELKIEQDLLALRDALKEASRPGGQGGGQCKGCNGNRNKLLAELKMLRWMQTSLLKRSERLAAQATEGSLPIDSVDTRSQPLSDQQRSLQRLTLELHDMSCPDCIGTL